MRAAILLLIFGILLFAGCVQQAPPVQTPPVQTPEQPQAPEVVAAPEPCSYVYGVEAKNGCWFEHAKKTGNASECGRIYMIEAKDDCVYNFVSTSGDESVCGKLVSLSRRDECQKYFAYAKNSTEPCLKIFDEAKKAECMRTFSPPCTLEQTDEEKASCLAFLKNDYTFCADDACRFRFGKEKKAFGACGLMAEGAQKYACEALVLNDTGRCAQSGIASMKDQCLRVYAEEVGDVNVCDLARIATEYRNWCYNYFASKLQNSSVCQRAEPESARDECYMNYSSTVDDTAACPNVINTLNREICYFRTAYAHNDPSACNGLDFYNSRQTCYSKVIFAGKINYQLCGPIMEPLWQDKCYERMAAEYLMPELCENIADADTKATCQNKFPK
jgi:hypothetical protein